jgi:hypothetical protein
VVIAANALAERSPAKARDGSHQKLGGRSDMHGIAIIMAMKRCQLLIRSKRCSAALLR